ncbi:MAG: tetratricopeptide repeat protein [Bacteroidetes bacterium]|nr:tetratricopeptide repeat protein [Bacteroidota bacterium]
MKTRSILYSIFSAFFTAILLFSAVKSFSQLDYLKLKGKVCDPMSNLSDVLISVYQNHKKISESKSGIAGGYTVDFELQQDYEVEFAVEGYVSQKIQVKASVPKSELGGGVMEQEIKQIKLFKMVPGLDAGRLIEPVGIIKWEGGAEGWFEYKDRYDELVAPVLAKQKVLKEKVYREEMSKADGFFASGDYDNAWLSYERAYNFAEKPRAVEKKLAELKKAISEKESIDESYARAIEKADDLYQKEDLDLAENYYNKALSYKPDEIKPKNKLAEIKTRKQKLYEKRRAEYDSYLGKADQHFYNDEYEDSWSCYKSALKLFPDEQYPVSQMEKLKTLTTEEKVFTKYIEKAGKNFASDDLDGAEEYYNKALAIKPEAQEPKDKLAEIKQIREKAKEEEEQKLKLENEYSDAFAGAVEAENKGDLDKALILYKKAYQLKPGEEQTGNKITEIEGTIARLTAERKEKELEAARRKKYNDNITAGDNLLKEENYTEAMKHFQEAFQLYPDEKYPREKFEACRFLQASANVTADLKNDNNNNLLAVNNLLKNLSNQSDDKNRNNNMPGDTSVTTGMDKQGKDSDTNLNAGTSSGTNTAMNDSDDDRLLEYYSKSLKEAEKLGDKEKIAGLQSQIAVLNERAGKYKAALESYEKSLGYFEKSGNKKVVCETCTGIGKVYHKMNNYDKALDFYKRSLEISGEEGDKATSSDVMNKIATVLYDSGNYETSIDYFEKALSIKEELGDKESTANIMNDLGTVLENSYRYDKSIE